MTKNEEFLVIQSPSGSHDLKETWKLSECPYPKINNDGEFIWKSLYISVDPYMSSQITKNPALGGIARKEDQGPTAQSGHVTAIVLESRNKEFPVGTIFVTRLPWVRYGIYTGEFKHPYKTILRTGKDQKLPQFEKFKLIDSITALGMPSQTAYYGITQVGKFKESDIVVISGAAGATGSIAGQIAKKVLKCKKVIGIAGGKDKCKLLTEELGYDYAIDYKEATTKEAVIAEFKKILSPGESITGYFDNTGGFVTDAVFDVIAPFGVIVICGQISAYHKTVEKPEDVNVYPNYLAKTIYRQLSILGFVVSNFLSQNDEKFFKDMPEWIQRPGNPIITKETVVEGFDKLPEAYEMLFTGKNTGKIVVDCKQATEEDGIW